ncbi:GTP cyclohydrolase I [uncultured Megasphaera sp.]|uniref:GTP cyclohydrolase I n=1 Tax=Megasphaera sp. TaxID=2023260 RepID=UPI0025F3A450|nr:GTP cyclohydrolase I [uncultured Megasphaera sp.]
MAENERAVAAMRQFLEALGLDLEKLGMEKTPHRVAQAFGEFFSGLWENPDDEWQSPIATQTDGLVVVRNIRFHSMCEHHLLPFFGSVHLAYYPKNGTIAGFGHFVRAVDILARRPQLQERMTEELCQSICRGLDPKGVLIVVKATHLCLTMRDRMAIDSNIVTTATAGCLKEGTEAYHQAWKMLMEEEENG